MTSDAPAPSKVFWGVFVLAITAFLLLGTIGTETAQRHAAAWVRRTIAVESKLDRLEALLRAAESGERGFLLTGDEAYLAPLEKLKAKMDAVIGDLRDLLGDSAQQREALEKVAPLAKERIDVLEDRVQTMKEGQAKDAVAKVRSGRGKRLMDRINLLLDQMRQEEARVFHEREQAYLATSEVKEIAYGFLFLAIAGSGLYTLFKSQKQLRDLKQAYEQVVEQSGLRLQAEAQLRQSQKLEALGHLAGGIAHDFNNQLAVIVASLNILRRRAEGVPGCEELCRSAEGSADRAARLVRRLLAFSREQPLDPKAVDPNELIEGLSQILKRTLGASVEIETHLADGLWRTYIDGHELENALLNLAVNARDAMPQGGRLIISTENAVIDARYRAKHPDVEPGQYVLISVTDTGEGMTPLVAARAFDPFFTTKPVGKGTGLGLSQVHGFVKQSNGHLKIYSEPGRGTSVKLLFPRFLGEVSSTKETDAAASSLLLGKPEDALLIVDDDESARRMTALAARELGYTTFEAEDGPSALSTLRAHPEINLLITDVVMPGMDGAKLSREAVFRRHNLQVLYVTGYPRSFLLGRDLRRSARVLSKPFTLVEFAQAVRSAFDTPQRTD
ncbi:CHASE3 domain-containing protein [Methylocystis echinoides]|uniref:histidine kinase n=1 Tax=Methylocystis echinoides TaxID=29468 RepID=A0A9W6GUN5_9HYPH|nr:CHASE3 domain-containing protein [Methylocystis echinoides]GLI93371.1 histidine kinase [Methylocystis echinoides]